MKTTRLVSLLLSSDKGEGSDKYLMLIKMLCKRLISETKARKKASQFIEAKSLTDEFEAFLGV